jgi:hypothetical protein
VASSQRLRRVKAEDGRVDAMCYIGLFYPNFVVFFVLGHRDSLVISFSINMTPRAGGEVSNSAIPLPLPSYSSFLRGLSVLHGVSKKIRVDGCCSGFTPCRCLILSI